MNIQKVIKRRFRKISWKLFYVIVRIFPRLGYGYPIIGKKLKKIFKLDPSEQTQTYVINLNENFSEKDKNVILPIDMMKQMIIESKYRAIMHGCLCRTAHSCTTYPINHGCIFIGESAKAIVEKRVGYEASVEESIAHVDRGVEFGLIGHAMWVEVEKHLFGFKTGDGVAHWLEICFCCPCCCSAFKLIKSTNQLDIKQRFRSIGWKAYVDSNLCNKCLICLKKCPVNAISVKEDYIVINEEACLGCGLCAANCNKKAITLNLQSPLKDSIQDYFRDGGLEVDV